MTTTGTSTPIVTLAANGRGLEVWVVLAGALDFAGEADDADEIDELGLEVVSVRCSKKARATESVD